MQQEKWDHSLVKKNLMVLQEINQVGMEILLTLPTLVLRGLGVAATGTMVLLLVPLLSITALAMRSRTTLFVLCLPQPVQNNVNSKISSKTYNIIKLL
jgi:hypothetical protein